MTRTTTGSLILTCLLLSGVAASGAQGMQSRRIVERHPTAENIPDVTDPRFILHEDAETIFLNEDSNETVTIGVEDGEYEEMFGAIGDVVATDDGTLLVLDWQNSEVRVFDYEGSLLGIFGGPGEGPGEFRQFPGYGLSLADQGRYVFAVGFFDPLVTAFERQDSDVFAPVLSFPKDLSGETGCAMNGYFWFFGYSPAVKGVLHKFTYEGERVASFLDYYKSPREYISYIMSRHGEMACSEEHGVVALNRVNAPVVTGYNEEGDKIWQIKLADFDPLQYVELSNPGWDWDTPERGKAQLISLFSDSSGDFYVQYRVAEGAGFESFADRGPLFRIDAQTGEGTYFGQAPHVWDIDGDYVFSGSNDPYPQVVIHKRKRAGD